MFPVATTNVQKLHINPFNSYWDILVWTSVLEYQLKNWTELPFLWPHHWLVKKWLWLSVGWQFAIMRKMKELHRGKMHETTLRNDLIQLEIKYGMTHKFVRIFKSYILLKMTAVKQLEFYLEVNRWQSCIVPAALLCKSESAFMEMQLTRCSFCIVWACASFNGISIKGGWWKSEYFSIIVDPLSLRNSN